MVRSISCVKWQDKKDVQVANPPINTCHPLSQQKQIIAGLLSVTIYSFSCVSPAADGIKLPVCWRRLMLVLELHLPSRKDNQLSGVFNLKYSHWTMEHSAQPLHSAQIQGLDIITVLDRWAHLLCCTDVLSLQMKRLLLIQFTKGWTVPGVCVSEPQLQLLTRWRNRYGSRFGLASESLLEGCSVKCHGWSLNSSCQRRFAHPTVAAAAEEMFPTRGRDGKPSKGSERKQKWNKEQK